MESFLDFYRGEGWSFLDPMRRFEAPLRQFHKILFPYGLLPEKGPFYPEQ